MSRGRLFFKKPTFVVIPTALLFFVLAFTYSLYKGNFDMNRKATNNNINNVIKAIYATDLTSGSVSEIKNLGVNTIILNAFVKDNGGKYIVGDYANSHLDQINHNIKLANNNNLKVIIDVQGGLLDPKIKNNILNFIKQNRSNETIIGYYLIDEPEYWQDPAISPAIVKSYHSEIKNIDSTKSTIVMVGADLNLSQKYFGIADIDGLDFYPFTNDALQTQTNLTKYDKLLKTFDDFHTSTNTKEYLLAIQAFTDSSRRVPTAGEMKDYYLRAINTSYKFHNLAFFAWNSIDPSINPTINNVSIKTSISNFMAKFPNALLTCSYKSENQSRLYNIKANWSYLLPLNKRVAGVDLCVSADNEPFSVFINDAGENGSSNNWINWILPNKNYTFTLFQKTDFSKSCVGNVLSQCQIFYPAPKYPTMPFFKRMFFRPD